MRIGAPEDAILAVQNNLANTYARLGRLEEAAEMDQNIYRGNLKLNGEENSNTLTAANNYANDLLRLDHFEEAKSLLRKMMPVARRVLGESNDLTLRMRTN